ncbi:non-specific lipid-transfer protein A-like [Durio zibethinus]|uniref:Non-specific lipid-transfer protein A-like n=1 Tax=Durio zibethinus TaxID=66656 RepID=A0A6P5Y4Y0_DURZI|nr:non-specific lipid-transfer protein A-like [Durio zibethinus]
MKGVVISVFVVLAMAQFMVNPGQAAVSCDQVNECLASCILYLTSRAGNLTVKCCGGVGKLQKIAETTANKQATCNCVKQAVARIPTIKKDATLSLLTKCNVQINFPIAKNTNCQEYGAIAMCVSAYCRNKVEVDDGNFRC